MSEWVIMSPLGPWFHIFNFFFFLSAIFEHDVLLIRLSLVTAFAFIIMNCISGLCSWEEGFWPASPRVSLDALFWGVLLFCIHTRALILMLLDQKKVKLGSENEEAVSRYLYRTAGMKEWEAKASLSQGRFTRFAAGDEIPSNNQTLYLLIDGKATFRTYANSKNDQERELLSGDLINVSVLNITGAAVGFTDIGFEVTCNTDCLLFAWSLESLRELTDGSNPALCNGWRNFGYYVIANACSRLLHKGMLTHPKSDYRGIPENGTWLNGARSRDFDVFSDSELPKKKNAFVDIFQWVFGSMSCTPIKGLRHMGPVPAGVVAQLRLLNISAMGSPDLRSIKVLGGEKDMNRSKRGNDVTAMDEMSQSDMKPAVE